MNQTFCLKSLYIAECFKLELTSTKQSCVDVHDLHKLFLRSSNMQAIEKRYRQREGGVRWDSPPPRIPKD